MFKGKGGAGVMKENVSDVAALAGQLATDKKFRRQLAAALGHGFAAQQRARSRLGVVAVAKGLGGDAQLRADLRQMIEELRAAKARVEKKRSHRIRNSLLILAGAGGAAIAAMPMRHRIASRMRSTEASPDSTPVISDHA
jgi:hypothetical protein